MPMPAGMLHDTTNADLEVTLFGLTMMLDVMVG